MMTAKALFSSSILEDSGFCVPSKPSVSLIAGLLFFPCALRCSLPIPRLVVPPFPESEVVLLSFPCSCCGLCTRRMPSLKVSLCSAAVPSQTQRHSEVRWEARPSPLR